MDTVGNELIRWCYRVGAIVLTCFMVSSAAVIIASSSGMDESNVCAEYVRMDIRGGADVSRLKASGVEIVEDYGSFVLAKMTPTQISALSNANNIERLPQLNNFKFNGYSFDVTQGEPAFPTGLTTYSSPGDTNYYFVRFKGPVKQEWKDALELTGAKICYPVDGYTFMVSAKSSQRGALSSSDSVTWVGEYYPAYKIAREVSSSTGEITMDVITFPDYHGYVVSRIAKLLQRTGLGRFFTDYTIPDTISGGSHGLIRIIADASLANDIARIPNVMYVERYEQPKTMNAAEHSMIQTGGNTAVGAPGSLPPGSYGTTVPVWNNGIFGQTNPQTGQPMVVGISDSGIRIDHSMFANTGTAWTNANWDTSNGHLNGDYNFSTTSHRKIVRYAICEAAGWDYSYEASADHGTHTACTLAGYDNPRGGTSLDDGHAPGAKISFLDIGKTGNPTSVYPPPDYASMWDLAKSDGARTYSMSWGGPYHMS